MGAGAARAAEVRRAAGAAGAAEGEVRAACRLVKRDEHEVQKKESRAVQLVARPRDGVARHEIAPIRPWPTPYYYTV